VATISVTEETRRRIEYVANLTGESMANFVARAVELLERQLFFADANARYGELRGDADAWAEIEEERALEI